MKFGIFFHPSYLSISQFGSICKAPRKTRTPCQHYTLQLSFCKLRCELRILLSLKQLLYQIWMMMLGIQILNFLAQFFHSFFYLLKALLKIRIHKSIKSSLLLLLLWHSIRRLLRLYSLCKIISIKTWKLLMKFAIWDTLKGGERFNFCIFDSFF